MRYMIFDIETNTRVSYDRKANPFDPRNNIILSQKKYSDSTDVVLDYDVNGTRDPKIEWDRFDTIVGHNLKFDLEYIWGNPELRAWLKGGGRLFDTMIAEFMITAQAHKYPSLNACAAKYGGTQKADVVKEYWDAGFDTTDIPEDILREYGKFDVLNTELVMLSQLEQMSRLGLLKLFWGFMDFYAALIEMEANGLVMDQEVAKVQRIDLEADLEAVQTRLKEVASKVLLKKEFNPNSPQQVKLVLQGGTYKYAELEPCLDPDGNPIVYGPKAQKAGQPKMKLVTYEVVVPSSASLLPSLTVTSTDEESLMELKSKKSASLEAKEFISLLQQSRKISKLISTYYESLAEVIHKHDGLIHPTLDCVSAVTGRLNSKNPNVQNMPPSIRGLFKSRFNGGKIVEFDFSQLEVRIQAFLAQSDRMMGEIEAGVDFHCIEEHTEVLTTTGWKLAKEVTPTDRLSVFENGKAVESDVLDLWHQPDTPLLRVHGRLSEEIVSRNHNLFLDGNLTNIQDLPYEKINQTRFTYSVISDACAPYSDNELRLLIQVITDAHVFKRHKKDTVNGIRWKLSKPRKIERLQKLLTDMGIPFKVNLCPKTGINKLQPLFIIVYGEWQNWIFRQVGFDKKLPPSLKGVTPHQLNVIVEELSHTDGCKKNRHIVWSTTDRDNAELLQTASILAGMACKITDYKSNTKFVTNMKCLAVTFYPCIHDRGYVRIEPAGLGTVVGITSTTGTLITRRNGIVNFTGNCKRLAYAEELSYEQVCKNLQENPAVWGEKRKQIKTVSFQKAYGAGTKRIAEVTGLPLTTVETIFNKEDQDYPEIGFYNQTKKEAINYTRIPTDNPLPIRNFETGELEPTTRRESYQVWVEPEYDIITEYTYTESGQELCIEREVETQPGHYITKYREVPHWTLAQGVGYFTGLTGRRYHFLERGRRYASGLRLGFSDQEIANYDIQGTAADTVALSIGRVYRYLLENDLTDKIKLINTVHDSLVLDCDMVHMPAPALEQIKCILEDTAGTMESILGLKFNMPTVVDMSIGEYWE